MAVDCIIEDPRWDGIAALAERASDAALAHLGYDPNAFEISLLACGDARIAVLNADFRDKETATNVLSWPSDERGAGVEGDTPEAPELPMDAELGDIAIAFETCTREAQEAGKSMQDHTLHLLVHGTLHLLGYDHERDKDATLMERLEVEILGKLGVCDPYRDD
ncbi:rRNA maturation RNase YbeY [Loktanella sp. D2R18]|uniref:rRNA maturation RNase YbeY n=1 Tax=Rhodobacterales TaxID=204455 RepID=UPI000DE99457|nr:MULTISPECIES: rRNA maturation RNase YbeY [Rhodobacterales]MDO6588992.1 rRNA maturation RNase YbeY [Yoonia sp. 1_MG-2023]RBW41793.1 rRNA maturation RNase YbeY [Loktanella sp. D2R18]